MARLITEEEKALAAALLQKARAAMREAYDYDQERVDDLARAVGWAIANEPTFVALTDMAVDESGMGNKEGGPARRFKVAGILRDALRQKSVGIIEKVPEKGIVKYAKPAGVVAGLLPVTNPVGDDGRFLAGTPLVAGLKVDQANPVIIETLAKSGRLLHQGVLQHSYPVCWRHKTPLIFIASCGTIGSAPHHCHWRSISPDAFRLTIPNSST